MNHQIKIANHELLEVSAEALVVLNSPHSKHVILSKNIQFLHWCWYVIRSLTVLDLATAPGAFEDEIPRRRPRPVSARVADRFTLLTRAANPANPFDDELDELALADPTCLTCAAVVRRILLLTGLGPSSSAEDDGDGEGLAWPFFFHDFP